MTIITMRSDTNSNWNSSNAITPAVGEFCYATDTDILKIGNGSASFKNLPHFPNSTELTYTKLSDRLYDGVDLTKKFATEIASTTNVWAWLQTRIKAGNYDGIHVGDYIPVSLSAGSISDGTTTYNITAKTLLMQIAGIDTYYGYGDATVGHHIDFISTACIGTNIPWNPANNNNGTATYPDPFLASKIYACLNGINNVSTGYNNVSHGFDASSGGVKQLLPDSLRSVIIGKRVYSPTRYSASGLLTSSTSASWATYDGLWLPTEFEVYGSAINSGGAHDGYGLDRAVCGTPVQYPLFANSNSYRNHLNKSRVSWWLASVPYGSSAHACLVSNDGPDNAYDCTNTWFSVPVCFRVG